MSEADSGAPDLTELANYVSAIFVSEADARLAHRFVDAEVDEILSRAQPSAPPLHEIIISRSTVARDGVRVEHMTLVETPPVRGACLMIATTLGIEVATPPDRSLAARTPASPSRPTR